MAKIKRKSRLKPTFGVNIQAVSSDDDGSVREQYRDVIVTTKNGIPIKQTWSDSQLIAYFNAKDNK